MIDLAQLGALVANILGGVSILSVMIFAVVAWLKQLGLEGKQLTLAAFGAGLLFAGIIRYAFAPPQSFAEWVWTGVFGFMAGLLATGAYKGAESVLAKSVRPTKSVMDLSPQLLDYLKQNGVPTDQEWQGDLWRDIQSAGGEDDDPTGGLTDPGEKAE